MSAARTAPASSAVATFRVSTALAVLTCALAPAYVIRWHLGPLPTTVLEDAILLTVAAFAVEAYRAKQRLEWRSPFTIPAAVFLVAGAISVVVSPEQVKGLGLYRAYLVEPIAFYFVLGHVLSNALRAKLMLAGLAAGGAVAGLANAFVIVQAIRHHTLVLALPPPVVIYNTPNAVAAVSRPVDRDRRQPLPL